MQCRIKLSSLEKKFIYLYDVIIVIIIGLRK